MMSPNHPSATSNEASDHAASLADQVETERGAAATTAQPLARSRDQVVAAFTDPRPNANFYHAWIDWGDGSPPSLGRVVKLDSPNVRLNAPSSAAEASTAQEERRFEVRGDHEFFASGDFEGKVVVEDALGERIELTFRSRIFKREPQPPSNTAAVVSLPPAEPPPSPASDSSPPPSSPSVQRPPSVRSVRDWLPDLDLDGRPRVIRPLRRTTELATGPGHKRVDTAASADPVPSQTIVRPRRVPADMPAILAFVNRPGAEPEVVEYPNVSAGLDAAAVDDLLLDHDPDAWRPLDSQSIGLSSDDDRSKWSDPFK